MNEKILLPSVSFSIGIPDDTLEAVYICGDIEKLGDWNPQAALRVKRSKTGAFSKTIRLPQNTAFQFKILSKQSFEGVEKGRYFEELENRFGIAKNQKNKLIVEVKNFNQ